MKAIYARGAYGRLASLADWEAGKDFWLVNSHLYFSIRDADHLKRVWSPTVVFLDINGRELFRVYL